MNYLTNNYWNSRANGKVVYNSEKLNNLPDAIFSTQKTYDEGIDVIRSIHKNENKFIVVSSTESRVSGPSECLEKTVNTYNEAEIILIESCKEDDAFYN